MLVMNTIPTTFNAHRVPHTVIGGSVRKTDEPVEPLTVILLNRGGRFYRSAVFQNLENAGIASVISVEMSAETYDVESLSARFPRVKFLVPLEKVSVGELINTAMAETQSPRVLVLWNDQRLPQSGIPQRILDRLDEDPVLCMVPSLTGQKLETVPVCMIPAFSGKSLTVEPIPGARDLAPTVYAFDYSGIYDRSRFMALGGYDPSIVNPYWQNLDFGFRSYLWGERLVVSTSLRLTYEGEIPREDVTPDSSYIVFYLKNLAPIHGKKGIEIPRRAFFTLLSKGGHSIFESIALFSSISRWVKENKERFVADARTVTASWELQ